jgi:hypothetical protein
MGKRADHQAHPACDPVPGSCYERELASIIRPGIDSTYCQHTRGRCCSSLLREKPLKILGTGKFWCGFPVKIEEESELRRIHLVYRVCRGGRWVQEKPWIHGLMECGAYCGQDKDTTPE